MTETPPATALTIVAEFRKSSSLPVLVETDRGDRVVVKWNGTAEGPAACATEWTALLLARLAGIPTPQPCLVRVTTDLIRDRMDPDISDLIRRSVGVNLGLEYLGPTRPFAPAHEAAGDETVRDLLYCFDALVLNIDRTDHNPNMVLVRNKLYCVDFASSMAVRMLAEGSSYREELFYPLVRRHPFYRPRADVRPPNVAANAGAVEDIVRSIPGEWLTDSGAARRRLEHGLSDLLRRAAEILERRLAALDSTRLEDAKERDERLLANRRAFEASMANPNNR